MSKDTLEARKKFVRDYVEKHPLMASPSALYEELYTKWPEVTPGGHRGMVGRMLDDPPWAQSTVCPGLPDRKCGRVASNTAEAIELFGLRNKGRNFQSYCKVCRNAHAVQMRAKRAERAAQEQPKRLIGSSRRQ